MRFKLVEIRFNRLTTLWSRLTTLWSQLTTLWSRWPLYDPVDHFMIPLTTLWSQLTTLWSRWPLYDPNWPLYNSVHWFLILNDRPLIIYVLHFITLTVHFITPDGLFLFPLIQYSCLTEKSMISRQKENVKLLVQLCGLVAPLVLILCASIRKSEVNICILEAQSFFNLLNNPSTGKEL